MLTRLRPVTRALAARWLGDQAIPVGDVARMRRALRRALSGRPLGRVLVIGPGLAARQAFGQQIDVAGTSPHAAEVTICSAARRGGSLPPGRWDTVIITEPGHLIDRLAAVRPACRPGALLVVVDSARRGRSSAGASALRQLDCVEQVSGRGRSRIWVSTVHP